MNCLSVLMVEDEAGIRQLVQLYLQKKGYSVLVAENGAEAVKVVEEQNPDIILLDIQMPQLNGFKACEEIRAYSKAPIIFLSCQTELTSRLRGLQIGGDDYMTKPFDFRELDARIQAIVRRRRWERSDVDEEILSYGDLRIHVDSGQTFVRGKEIKLLHKEFQLLLFLAKHPNRIWTADHLYDRIWGFLSDGSSSTVKVHISHLRKKIEKYPANPKYIHTIRGFGYKFNPHDIET